MPVLVVTAAPLPELDRALAALSLAVATTLQLPDHAVVTNFVPAGPAYRGGTPVAPWPVALLLGRRRDGKLMDAAESAVRAELAAAWARDQDEVHVQWVPQ